MIARLLVKYLGIDAFIPCHHRVDRESLPNVLPAGLAIYIPELSQRLHGFVNVVDQEPSLTVSCECCIVDVATVIVVETDKSRILDAVAL